MTSQKTAKMLITRSFGWIAFCEIFPDASKDIPSSLVSSEFNFEKINWEYFSQAGFTTKGTTCKTKIYLASVTASIQHLPVSTKMESSNIIIRLNYKIGRRIPNTFFHSVWWTRGHEWKSRNFCRVWWEDEEKNDSFFGFEWNCIHVLIQQNISIL